MRFTTTANQIMDTLSVWSSSRIFMITALVCFSGLGVYFLFLAAIGFHYSLVPADALNQLMGRPRIIRWLDEAVFGIPVAQFWCWGTLLSGLVFCTFAIYSAREMRRGDVAPKITAEAK